MNMQNADSLIEHAYQAADGIQDLVARARQALSSRLTTDGRPDNRKFDREQRAAHGLAWLATYGETIRRMAAYGDSLLEKGKLGPAEGLLVQIGVGEYCAQVIGGIPMNQGEILRPADLGLSQNDISSVMNSGFSWFSGNGNSAENRAAFAKILRDGDPQAGFADSDLDETLTAFADEMRRFAQSEILPHAHQWHLDNAYIPLSVIEKMAELGVFGLTIPEEYDGLGLGKESMCVVSEELSRAYIGVGSLGTRSEIAAELILCGGTDEQKAHWLPKIASGTILPTAVFTEPNTGSDLASLNTRAIRDGNSYHIHGNKTWITHPVRADVMTLLARTNPDEPGYRGLSMFLATKTRGTDENPFPDTGLTGGEIEVLGYRGMKEYELAFDGFEVDAGSLLGGEEGQGFKQLMQTFESARVQTAARAVGVAQSAFDVGLRYASDRIQFGQAIIHFPRVADKLVMMAAETMMARQLTYFAARQKDSGRRCDQEAGMAKLLAARIAWANADNALQIHGGNGFALEYEISRLLCDARILNIFEGAGEIQAHVIARRLMEAAN